MIEYLIVATIGFSVVFTFFKIVDELAPFLQRKWTDLRDYIRLHT